MRTESRIILRFDISQQADQQFLILSPVWSPANSHSHDSTTTSSRRNKAADMCFLWDMWCHVRPASFIWSHTHCLPSPADRSVDTYRHSQLASIDTDGCGITKILTQDVLMVGWMLFCPHWYKILYIHINVCYTIMCWLSGSFPLPLLSQEYIQIWINLKHPEFFYTLCERRLSIVKSTIRINWIITTSIYLTC